MTVPLRGTRASGPVVPGPPSTGTADGAWTGPIGPTARQWPSSPAEAVLASGPSCQIDSGGHDNSFRLIGEVGVGLDPEGVAVDTATGLVYVACSRSDAVYVVDPDALAVVGSIPVGGEPIDIVFDEMTGRLFTADARSDQVSVIDAGAGAVVATVAVGCYPAGLCLDPEGRRLYCGDAAGSTVSVVDVDRLECVGTVDAELGAGAIAVDRARDRVYCVNFIASTLSVIEGTTLATLSKIPLAAGPCAVGVHPASGDVFVADSLASTVSRINPAGDGTVVGMPVPNAPVGLTMGSQGDRLYVGNRGDGTVSVVGLDGIEWSRIPVGAAPGGVTEDPLRAGRVYAANAGSGSITIFDDLLAGPTATTVAETAHPMVGQAMADLSLPDLYTGELRDLGEWAGKKYVINVFASW